MLPQSSGSKLPWRWRRHDPVKLRYPLPLLYGVATQNTAVWTFSAVTTWKLTSRPTSDIIHVVCCRRRSRSSVASGLSVYFVCDHMFLSACVLYLPLVGVMAVPPSLHFVLLLLTSWLLVWLARMPHLGRDVCSWSWWYPLPASSQTESRPLMYLLSRMNWLG
jgi:hypothetical protein